MPWKETCTMDQRIEFIADYLSSTLYKMRRGSRDIAAVL